MRIKSPQKLLRTIALIALCCVVLMYVGYQAMLIFFTPYKTELTELYTVTDELHARGIAVRDEMILNPEALGGKGFYVYRINSGDKIAKGAVVAEVYALDSDVDALVRLERYRQEREILIKLNNLDSSVTDFSAVRATLKKQLASLASSAGAGDLRGYSSAVYAVIQALGAYDNIVGEGGSYSERIAWLNERIDKLEALNITPVRTVAAEETGYFVNTTDGFEAAVSKDSALKMSVGDISRLLEKPPVFSAGTKLVSDYEWYFCAVLDGEHAIRFKQGGSVLLSFDYAGVNDIPARIKAVISDEDSDRIAVIFSVSYFNGATANLRLENATISFSTYSGIRVARSSLQLHEGETGVFVKQGDRILFRRLEILYETDSYVLVNANTKRSGYLWLYDEIVIAGRDLYHGKIVQ